MPDIRIFVFDDSGNDFMGQRNEYRDGKGQGSWQLRIYSKKYYDEFESRAQDWIDED